MALSPAVEEEYRKLTRDYATAQKFYDDTSKQEKDSETQTDMEREQQGEQMQLQNPADMPESPTFPNRFIFAGGGLAGGWPSDWDWPCGWSCATSRCVPNAM